MKNQYNGLIHTNLVVLVISTVPYSYQDFLSTAIAVGFRTGISEGKYFQESRQAFPEKWLYNKLLCKNVTIGNGLPVKQPDGQDDSWAKNFTS